VSRHEDVFGNEGIAQRILNLITRWRKVIGFTLQPLYPQGKSPSTHWIGVWVGLKAGMDVMVRRKQPFTAPAGNQNSIA